MTAEQATVVRFHSLGGPEVLQVEQAPIGAPGAGEARIRVEAIGVNRAEALVRSGHYIEPVREFPAGLGSEVSGVIDLVGPGVTGLEPGDPVSVVPAFSQNDYPVYADRAIVPAAAVLPRPDGTDAITGAATWMAYLTAYGALVEPGIIHPGDTIVLNAASSSVGLALIQIANHLGVHTIALTRTATKAAALANHGATHVITTGPETDAGSQFPAAPGRRGVEVGTGLPATAGQPGLEAGAGLPAAGQHGLHVGADAPAAPGQRGVEVSARPTATAGQRGPDGSAGLGAVPSGDLAAQVKALTCGRGVPLVLDAVAGPGISDLAQLVSPGGTLLVYGASSGQPTPYPGVDLGLPALTIRSYTMHELSRDARRLARAAAFITAGLRSGAFRPVVAATYPLSDAVAAHKHLESNSHLGKLVLTVP
ncbi:zinc-binding dehydrogenase [Kribbella sp. NPDC051770]|uniref:zinc-dependent alcohol dehydrogenase family protein n=1 Tax=Kribbella sp. NPDC051770 TaxID=3155413 RepID=UPI003440C0FA